MLNPEDTKNIVIQSEFAENHHIVLAEDDSLAQLRQLPDQFFQLVISSPPYNIGKSYEQKSSLENYLAWQTDILQETVRILRPTGNLIWQVGNYIEDGEVFPLDMYFYPILKKLGLKLRNRLVWHFEHGLHASKRFSGRYETLLWFSKSDEYVFNLDNVRIPSKYPGKLHYKGDKAGLPSGNPLGKNPSDLWKFIQTEWESGVLNIPNVKSNHPEKTEHPCQFPVELAERCVLALSNAQDWVLDPFGGVGSSVIAALKHERHAMMVERDPKYIQITKQRVKDWQNGNLKLRPLGKPVHTPTGREKITQIPTHWTSNLPPNTEKKPNKQEALF